MQTQFAIIIVVKNSIILGGIKMNLLKNFGFFTPRREKNHRSNLTKFIALAVSTVMVFSSTAVNSVAQAASSNSTVYYQKVEQNNLDQQINTFTKCYAAYMKNYQKALKGTGSEATIQVKLDPSIAKLIKLDGLNTIKAAMTSMGKGFNTKSTVSVSCNDKELTTFDMYTTLNNIYYFLVPDLSKAYLKLDYNKLLGIDSSAKMQNEIQNNILSFFNKPISEDSLNQLLKKYATVAISQVNNVKKSKNSSITVNGVKDKCTKLTAHISNATSLDIGSAILNTVKKDTKLKNIFASFGVKEKSYNSTIQEGLKGIAKERKSLKAKEKSKDAMVMDVWVDSDGKIVGRSFKDKSDGSKTTFGYQIVKKDSTKNFNAWLTNNGKDVFRANGNAVVGATGINGNIKLAFSDTGMKPQSVDVAIKDLICKPADNGGVINGEFVISGKALSGMTANVKLSGTQEKQDILCDVVKDQKTLVSVSISSKEIPYVDFSLPCSPDKIYDFSDLTLYVQNSNLKKYLEGIKEKSDVPAINAFADTILAQFSNK
jgi:hypothetical protein